MWGRVSLRGTSRPAAASMADSSHLSHMLTRSHITERSALWFPGPVCGSSPSVPASAAVSGRCFDGFRDVRDLSAAHGTPVLQEIENLLHLLGQGNLWSKKGHLEKISHFLKSGLGKSAFATQFPHTYDSRA